MEKRYPPVPGGGRISGDPGLVEEGETCNDFASERKGEHESSTLAPPGREERNEVRGAVNTPSRSRKKEILNQEISLGTAGNRGGLGNNDMESTVGGALRLLLRKREKRGSTRGRPILTRRIRDVEKKLKKGLKGNRSKKRPK